MTLAEAQHKAILSLLDVVEELCQGLAAKQQPQQDWADVVVSSFKEHRQELLEAER